MPETLQSLHCDILYQDGWNKTPKLKKPKSMGQILGLYWDICHSSHAVKICPASTSAIDCLESGNTRLRNDLLCVEWDVKPYTLTHSRSSSYVKVIGKRHWSKNRIYEPNHNTHICGWSVLGSKGDLVSSIFSSAG